MKKYYLNLTNGLEAFEYDSSLLYHCGFIRIQSTLCEQKNWDRIIQELDYDFLLNVAIGNEVVVYDFGANKEIPRALYQGMKFIEYSLNRRWFNTENEVYISRSRKKQGQNSTKYFRECYDKLDDRTKKKLDYFKPFLNKGNFVNISCVSTSTIHDGDRDYYKKLMYEYCV